MKTTSTFKTIISGSLLFLGLNLSAGNGLESQKEIIQHAAILPSLQVSDNEKVEMLFTTDENGKVNFVLAKTQNNELKTALEKKFSALSLSGFKANVVNSVTLCFKSVLPNQQNCKW